MTSRTRKIQHEPARPRARVGAHQAVHAPSRPAGRRRRGPRRPSGGRRTPAQPDPVTRKTSTGRAIIGAGFALLATAIGLFAVALAVDRLLAR